MIDILNPRMEDFARASRIAEAEKDAALMDEIILALIQYRNDLIYPPAPDSIERRKAMISALLNKIGAQ